MNSLNEDQMAECQEIFNFLDTNRNNFIDLEELFLGENSIGLNLDDDERQAIFERFGEIEGNSLTFEGFVEFYKDCICTHKISREEAEKMFRDFDLNHDRFLDFNDLRYMLIGQGEIVSEDEVNSLLRDYDVNGDGKLNLDEFLQSLYG
jgi:calmodulin